MDISKVKLAVITLLGIHTIKVKNFGFMLLSVVMMFMPVVAQADMVFDFQMKLAQKGNVEAQFKVGEMYETGFGVEQDLAEATKWITKAADRGHETAGFKLLFWDLEKNGMTNANKINVGALKAKAKNNDPQASYYLGKMYSRGVGVKKSSKSAVAWLNKAAQAGIAEAESELVTVRETQQRQVTAKRRAQLKAKQDRERQAQLEERRKIKAQQRAQKAAEEARAEEIARQNAADEKARKQEAVLANEKAAKEKARLLELKQAQQRETQEREAQMAAKKKALLIKQQKEAAKQKASFESDPCSGKSARFLSTCK